MQDPTPRSDPMRTFLPRLAIAAITVAFAGMASAQDDSMGGSTEPVVVDCDAGDVLQEVLAEHGSGATLALSGTCDAPVTVAHDGVTLDGGGDAVIASPEDPDAPGVHVDGARNVTIRDLVVDGGQHGILVERLATIDLEGVTVRNANSHGVEVIDASIVARELHAHDNGRVGLNVNRNSELRLYDAVLENNGISGMILFSGSLGRLENTNVIRGNGAQGLTLGLGGRIFTIGAELVIEENGAEGLMLLQGGSAQFLGGTLHARANAGDGMALRVGSEVTFGRDDFQVPGEATLEGNGGHGLAAYEGSEIVAQAIMPVTARGNDGAGLHVEDGSGATVRAGTFTDNTGADVALDFGARATLDDVDAGVVTCGEGVLLRGEVACP